MSKSVYAEFLEKVAVFLKQTSHTSPSKSVPASEIIIFLKQSGIPLSDSTIKSYLSRAARGDNTSGLSPGERGGYYLDEKVKETNLKLEVVEPVVEARVGKLQQREKKLYPALREWLEQDGYAAEIVANGCGGEKWSNPDVCGIRIESKFGIRDIEIATIEAKIGLNQWRLDLFEAVSHKRFSNRVYFSYLTNKDATKIDEDIYLYCEKFKIGLLQTVVENNIYSEILSGKIQDNYKIDIFDIREMIPAPYEYVPVRSLFGFIEQLEIYDDNALFQFGRRKIT